MNTTQFASMIGWSCQIYYDLPTTEWPTGSWVTVSDVALPLIELVEHAGDTGTWVNANDIKTIRAQQIDRTFIKRWKHEEFSGKRVRQASAFSSSIEAAVAEAHRAEDSSSEVHGATTET